jgi:hypothetical protein
MKYCFFYLFLVNVFFQLPLISNFCLLFCFIVTKVIIVLCYTVYSHYYGMCYIFGIFILSFIQNFLSLVYIYWIQENIVSWISHIKRCH